MKIICQFITGVFLWNLIFSSLIAVEVIDEGTQWKVKLAIKNNDTEPIYIHHIDYSCSCVLVNGMKLPFELGVGKSEYITLGIPKQKDLEKTPDYVMVLRYSKGNSTEKINQIYNLSLDSKE